jgi:hypothetical protein
MLFMYAGASHHCSDHKVMRMLQQVMMWWNYNKWYRMDAN